MAILFPMAFVAMWHAGLALDILAYASPVSATSHQYALARLTRSLVEAGHHVTMVVPEWFGRSIEKHGNLSVLNMKLMSDDTYRARFQKGKGESFQRLSQEVNTEMLPQVLPELRKQHFDLAVVDALYPILAKELRLPSVHIQCYNDPDFSNALWFHYGLTAERSLPRMMQHLLFASAWFVSWLQLGTHQESHGTYASDVTFSWGQYYSELVLGILMQGTSDFALPREASVVVARYPSRMAFIGSLTALATATPPLEASADATLVKAPALALVTFGTNKLQCPVELIKALALVDLLPVVLVESCSRFYDELPTHHKPVSLDQAAWLKEPRLRLVVLHGGMHSLFETLRAGLPIACVPHEGDQWGNCRDLQRSGLGWAVHPQAPADEASEVFRMLLRKSEDSKAQRSIAVAAAFEAAGGPQGAVQKIEALAKLLMAQRSKMVPFFAAPWQWAEGWLVVFLCCSALFLFLLYGRSNGRTKLD